MKKFLAMFMLASTSVFGMINLHEDSLNNKAIHFYLSSSFDNEYCSLSDELNLENEVIYVDNEVNVDKNISLNPEKSDSELIFEMSGLDSSVRTNNSVDENGGCMGYVESAVRRFEDLENSQINGNKQLVFQQREIVYRLQNLEEEIELQIDELNDKYREINDKIVSQYMSVDGKVDNSLKKEHDKVLNQLIYLKEALRISVKRIDPRTDSSKRLKQIFEDFEIDDALKGSKDFECALNRLGILNGKIRVTRLNSLEDLVLNSSISETILSSLICTNLRRLKLIDYKKSEKLRQLMQNVLCNANKLEELDFSHNELSGTDLNNLIQTGNWTSHIKILNLSNNRINGIPEVLNRFKNLKTLNLNDNWVNKKKNSPKEDREHFSDIISFINKEGNLPNLNELHISGFKGNPGEKKWILPKQLRVLEIDGESFDYIPENRIDIISGPSCQMYEQKKLKCTIYLKDFTRRNSYILGC